MKVTLTFVLEEDVTPDLFAQRVALACARGYALRPGEAIEMPSDPARSYRVGYDPLQIVDHD